MSFLSKFKFDKNNDSSLKYLFFIIFIIGFIVIWISSALKTNGYVPLFILIILMFGYLSCVYYFKEKNNYFVRDEQLGDSFYYLGFLFTLSALAATLFFLAGNNEDDVDQILQKFGIAIITTLIGMIGRIMLSQFKESLDEMKERTEEQVDRSVRKLKEQLDSSIDMLSQQTENITKNTDRALRDNSASLKFFMEENNKILKENNKVLEETIHTLKQTIDEFNSRVSEVSLKLAKIKIPTDDFQNFEKSINTFVSSLNSLEKGIHESNTKEELIETAKSFKSLSTSINQQSKILNNEFVVTKETLENLSKNLVGVAKFISENLKTK